MSKNALSMQIGQIVGCPSMKVFFLSLEIQDQESQFVKEFCTNFEKQQPAKPQTCFPGV